MVRFAAIAFAAVLLCGPAEALAQNVEASKPVARESSMDVSVGIGMIRDSDHHAFAGVRETTAFNVSESLAIVVEAEWLVAIAERSSSGRIIRDNQAAALGGIRLRKFVESPAVPYLQVTAGYVGRQDNGLQLRRSLFAFRSDGGLDLHLSDHFSVRAGIGWTFLFADVPYRNQFGGTVGGTLSLGKR